MDVLAGLHDRAQHVVGRVDIVIDGVALVLGGLHRIGGRSLLGVVDDGVRVLGFQQLEQAVVVLRDVQFDDINVSSRELTPDRAPLNHGADRRQGLDAQFLVDPTSGEVVDDNDVVAASRKVKGCRPAAEAVATQNKNLHRLPSYLPVCHPSGEVLDPTVAPRG